MWKGYKNTILLTVNLSKARFPSYILQCSGPQPFWHQRRCLHGRQFFHGRGGGRGMVQTVMWAMVQEVMQAMGSAMGNGRCSFVHFPHRSPPACAARFLKGRGPVLGPGLGTPASMQTVHHNRQNKEVNMRIQLSSVKSDVYTVLQKV